MNPEKKTPKDQPQPVEVIQPSGDLKRKAPQGSIDLAAALAQAQQVIEEQKQGYPERLKEDVAKLKQLHAANKMVPDARSLKDLNFLCHDMKGQGSTFGYDLVTLVCDTLCAYIDKLEAITPHTLEVIGVHVDALSLISKQGLTGMGSQTGDILVKGLHKVLEKEIKDK